MASDRVAEISRAARLDEARGELVTKAFEVERAALAAYLFDYVSAGDRVLECPDGYEDDWLDPLHREIWLVVRELAGDGFPATPAAVWSRMSDRMFDDSAADEAGKVKNYVAGIGRSMAIGRPSDAIRLVREMANRRRLVEAARELEEQAYRLDVQPLEVIAPAAAQLDAIRLDRQSKPTSLQEVAYRIADGLLQPLPCYSTGLSALDEALGGGIYAGKLYGIAAKRKHAKTISLGTICTNIAAAGVPVLFFALEMGEEGIAQRIVARHLHTNSMAFLHRENPYLERDTRRYADECDVPLFFEDRPGLTFQALKSMCAEYVARHGIKVIGVDYFQLIGGRNGRQSMSEHLDAVAQWMADFCNGTSTAMICPSQINREGEARGGDGFRLACDMFLQQHKVQQPDQRTEGIWLEMMDSRYTPLSDIGSAEVCRFFIHKHGPHLAQY